MYEGRQWYRMLGLMVTDHFRKSWTGQPESLYIPMRRMIICFPLLCERPSVLFTASAKMTSAFPYCHFLILYYRYYIPGALSMLAFTKVSYANSMSITWEHFRNENSLILIWPHWIRLLGLGLRWFLLILNIISKILGHFSPKSHLCSHFLFHNLIS